jgi:hypothetical protein
VIRRRRIGLVLLLVPVPVIVVLLIVRVTTGLQLELGIVVHRWLGLPTLAATLAGSVLLAPEAWTTRPRPWRWRIAGAFARLVSGGALVAIAAWLIYLRGHGYRLIELEDPGPFERAVLQATGCEELNDTLWAREPGARRMEPLPGPREYALCRWPIEVRRSPGRARYLVVDSERRAVRLVDLDAGGYVPLAGVEELRAEFGSDLTSVVEEYDDPE